MNNYKDKLKNTIDIHEEKKLDLNNNIEIFANEIILYKNKMSTLMTRIIKRNLRIIDIELDNIFKTNSDENANQKIVSDIEMDLYNIDKNLMESYQLIKYMKVIINEEKSCMSKHLEEIEDLLRNENISYTEKLYMQEEATKINDLYKNLIKVYKELIQIREDYMNIKGELRDKLQDYK